MKKNINLAQIFSAAIHAKGLDAHHVIFLQVGVHHCCFNERCRQSNDRTEFSSNVLASG